MRGNLSRQIYRLSLAVFFACGTIGQAAHAAAQTQVLPDFNNPKLRFGTGKVVDNKAQMSPILPSIPGPVSGWEVVQWSPFKHLMPNIMTQQDPATKDPDLGLATYAFTAPDENTHFWVYNAGAGGNPVFELFEQNGSVWDAGGRNLFLVAGAKQPVTMDHVIHFSMQAKISRAAVSYNTPESQKDGAVLGMAFIGFAMNFPSPVDGSSSVFFLQVGLANSFRNASLKSICTMSKAGRIIMTSGGDLGGTAPLPFERQAGPLKTIAFNVNDYVNAVFSKPHECAVQGGTQKMVLLSGINPGQIALKTTYIGLETQNSDSRRNATEKGPQGNIELGLQLSNVEMTE